MSTTTTTKLRTYNDAIDCLNSLQSNQAMIQASRDSGGRLVKYATHETTEYLSRIGYKPEDLNKLNVLHVTGTKGKGSTCAFIDSLLRHSMPQWTVGLYTSPHLVAVRERIRVNGKPISEEEFAKYFFEVWDRLEANDTRKFPETPPKPMYFRMCTIVAYHYFMQNNVDATILEVGVGGLYDCTNVVPKPIVTGVSALGIDHVITLGSTIRDIAYQKGGIYKEGVPAYTVNQPEDGLDVLAKQAKDRGASSFAIVPMTPGLQSIQLVVVHNNVKIFTGLAGSHQYQNANLAVHMVQEFLRAKASLLAPTTLSAAFVKGLENARWPGRCQTIVDPIHPGTTWFLDGAHTKDSLECCASWFLSPKVGLRKTLTKHIRVLVMNCTHDRNGMAFLTTVLEKAREQLQQNADTDVTAENFFDHVFFTTNVTYADGGFKGDLRDRVTAEQTDDRLKVQRGLADTWSTLIPNFPKENIHVEPSIQDTVHHIRQLKNSSALDDKESMEPQPVVDVLVTGSLLLVGGMIEVAGLSHVAL